MVNTEIQIFILNRDDSNKGLATNYLQPVTLFVHQLVVNVSWWKTLQKLARLFFIGQVSEAERLDNLFLMEQVVITSHH